MSQTEFYTHNLTAYMSKDYEAAVNTVETGDDDMLRVLVDGNAPPLPELLTKEAGNGIGSGNEFDTGTNILSDYFDVVRFGIGSELDSEIMGALWHQAQSGGLTNAPVTGASGAHDHSFGYAPDSSGFNVLTRTFVFDVGGIKYVYGGCGVDEYTVEWDGGEWPKAKAALIGTGWHAPLANYPDLALPTLEEQIPFNYLFSHGATLNWTGAPWGGSYDAAASGRFMAFSLTVKNNLRVAGHERQPNDPVITDADGYEGAVQNRLRRGKREATARVTLRLDNQTREFKAQKGKVICTNLNVAFPGPKIGATTARYTWAAVIPKFRVMKVTPAEMDGEEVLHLDLKLYRDTVTGGLVTGRVRNNVASSILALPS